MTEALSLLPPAALMEMAGYVSAISRLSREDEEALRLVCALAWKFSDTCASHRCHGPGHDTDSPSPVYSIGEGPAQKRYYRYPYHLVREDAIRAFNLVADFETLGLPPVPGGLLDQSAAFLDARRAISRARVEFMAKEGSG